LTGRYISINILPLPFLEFKELLPKTSDFDLFGQYINSSSLPEAAKLAVDSSVLANSYLLVVYNTILTRDIMVRHKIKDKLKFENIFNQ